MAQRVRTSSAFVGVAAVVIFLILLLVAQPAGDALSARGLSNGAIGALMSVLFLAFIGATILLLARGRRQQLDQLETAERAEMESWTTAAGWRPATGSADLPAVLDRSRVAASELIMAVQGDVAGLESDLAMWRQSFTNRGSPVSSSVHWLVLTTYGLPGAATIGVGRIGGSGLGGKMPSRWAGTPPVALVRAPSTQPWGLTRATVWPGPGVPPAPAWGEVAAELDAMRGWLLLQGGRLEIAVRTDPVVIAPQRVVALGERVIGLVGGLA